MSIQQAQRGFISQTDFFQKLLLKLPQYQNSLVTVNKNKKTYQIYNIPAAFDIEVSSFYQGGKRYDKNGKSNNEDKRAIMYIWQFGIDEYVTCGRTWTEYIQFIKAVQLTLNLSESIRLLVYVHNLPYEWQFMRKHFVWDKVFLLDSRKPVYARDGGVEYRCSLKLAGGKSLANIGKDLRNKTIEKKSGQLDYELIRTPKTPLKEEELEYCEYDIRVLLQYISEKIEDDGDISRIPLTNTTYVRNYCRKECFKRYKSYRQIMDNLVITGIDEYDQLKRAFMGGHTHASSQYVGRELTQVASYDIGSSYPSVLVLRKFPMSKATYIGVPTKEQFSYLIKTKCCLFDLKLTNVRPKIWTEHPISISKCWRKDLAIDDKKTWDGNDNGRLVTARSIVITVTEQDYITFREFYEWNYEQYANFRYYEKAYLPKSFVKAILKLYESKTKLKGDITQLVNYMISKNMINAAYGMTVTDIIREIIDYNNELNDYVTSEPDKESAIKKYNESKRRFMFYPWGIWVTAYARRNLFLAIKALGPDYIYADTDSVKFLNHNKHKKFFKEYNDRIDYLTDRAVLHFHISKDMFAPKNRKGIAKPIGLFEYEGTYDIFKTLGAKRYFTMNLVNSISVKTRLKIKTSDCIRKGKFIIPKFRSYSLTLAGCGKSGGARYLQTFDNPFEAFQINLEDKSKSLCIPAEYSNRLLVKFIDDEYEGDVVDYTGKIYHYHELSAIHMEPEPYQLTADDAFIRYLINEKWEDFY